MITAAEAKMRAARSALAAVQSAHFRKLGTADLTGADLAAVDHELDQIERRLLRDSVGGDKILLRQLSKPLGRQVRPSKQQAAAVEGLAKERGES